MARRLFEGCPNLSDYFIASEVCNQSAIWLVMFNDRSKNRLVVSGTGGHLLKLLEATLCGDKKKGPIKPSHQRQILPAQQFMLITANSWRSFQRGLYQGQEHLDLNYPWHNVWPFCYHWGGQHLSRGHGTRGHWGYSGQHCKHSPPQSPSQLVPHFNKWAKLWITEPTSNNSYVRWAQRRNLVNLGSEQVLLLVVAIKLRSISWDGSWTAGLSHDLALIGLLHVTHKTHPWLIKRPDNIHSTMHLSQQPFFPQLLELCGFGAMSLRPSVYINVFLWC